MKWTTEFRTVIEGDTAEEFHKAFEQLMERFPLVTAVVTHEENEPCSECNDGQVVSNTCDTCGERHCQKCDPCEEVQSLAVPLIRVANDPNAKCKHPHHNFQPGGGWKAGWPRRVVGFAGSVCQCGQYELERVGDGPAYRWDAYRPKKREVTNAV